MASAQKVLRFVFMVHLWGEALGGDGASGEPQKTSSSSCLASECLRISLTSCSSLIAPPANRRNATRRNNNNKVHRRGRVDSIATGNKSRRPLTHSTSEPPDKTTVTDVNAFNRPFIHPASPTLPPSSRRNAAACLRDLCSVNESLRATRGK